MDEHAYNLNYWESLEYTVKYQSQKNDCMLMQVSNSSTKVAEAAQLDTEFKDSLDYIVRLYSSNINISFSNSDKNYLFLDTVPSTAGGLLPSPLQH